MKKVNFTNLVVTLGIVYGDIGTSPLYVMQALLLIPGVVINEDYVLGCVSLVFLTLTLITTIKYVSLVLNADNNGEGGILSLYALVKNQAKWLVVPAIIGGSALMADSVLTPAITVTSAIEGLKQLEIFQFMENSVLPVVIITIIILSILFSSQRFGTKKIGRLFGPIMFAWFIFIGAIGVYNIIDGNLYVLKALNPMYGINLLVSHPLTSILVLVGSVFLATTGAEALYTDLGHVGKSNIKITWVFVKIMLLLNYFGQAAWILNNQAIALEVNPFFASMPPSLLVFGVMIATMAAIIASQALISGVFTMVSEAISLNLFPRFKIEYPADERGQVYLPTINFILLILCLFIVVFFKESEKMAAAYGLAITITMMMTSILLMAYLNMKNVNKILIALYGVVFLSIESLFFLSSTVKIFAGGYITLFITSIVIYVMFIWYQAAKINDQLIAKIPLESYAAQLSTLHNDLEIPLTATNLVYLSSVPIVDSKIDERILISILNNGPKRAHQIYIVHVSVKEVPYELEYEISDLGVGNMQYIEISAGFKLNIRLDQIVTTIIKRNSQKNGCKSVSKKYGIGPESEIGSIKYVILKSFLINSVEGSVQGAILRTKYNINQITSNPVNWFLLPPDEVVKETVTLRNYGEIDNLVEVGENSAI